MVSFVHFKETYHFARGLKNFYTTMNLTFPHNNFMFTFSNSNCSPSWGGGEAN